ncbi:MAG: hypothetical protein K2J82_06270 [Muribaculaceae bacterium]|nr:hypothetical protein [Muribaculaceae bacterium]
MEAFAPENIGAQQRREALSRMLENFLISAASPYGGITEPIVPSSGNIGISTPPQNLSNIEPTIEKTLIKEQTEPSPLREEEREIRYALSPVFLNGDYSFKRMKTKEDLDSISSYPYEVSIGETSGEFSVQATLDEFGNEEFGKSFPERVIEVINNGKSRTEASRMVTVEKGGIVKDGKNWKIIKRAKVKYE